MVTRKSELLPQKPVDPDTPNIQPQLEQESVVPGPTSKSVGQMKRMSGKAKTKPKAPPKRKSKTSDEGPSNMGKTVPPPTVP